MVLPNPLDPVYVGDPLPAAHNEERDAINTLDTAIEQRIPLPTGAMTGDLLRFDGINWVTTETRFMEGNGRPDGKVAAPVGSRYIDKVGAQGAVEWVKRAGGDTNTGWICLAGDTGLRDISDDVFRRNSATVYSAVVRRIGVMVDLYLDLTMPVNETSPWEVLVLPVGFRPNLTRHGLMVDNREGAATNTAVTSSGAVNLYGINRGKRDRWNGNWTTSDPWPSSLPGSPL